MKPFISIIIPVYNVAPFIKSCLHSVLNQTYKNIEIIIINDKTTDESISIIKDVLQKETPSVPIKIIEHAENKGLSSARNTGIKTAGESIYISWTVTMKFPRTVLKLYLTEPRYHVPI